VIDDIGFERLTTAMVAERAGASIGTVYRYFPDRIAVVEALAIRCTQRLSARFLESIDASGATTWEQGVDALVDMTIEMYRSEPGFRAIRFGDVDETAEDAGPDRMAQLGGTVSEIFRDRFGFPDSPRIAVAWDMLAEAGHAVLARAHRVHGVSDDTLVAEYRAMVTAYLRVVLADEA
jgi:AcrR family transcriptional regulator